MSSITVENPATGAVITTVPVAGEAEIAEAQHHAQCAEVVMGKHRGSRAVASAAPKQMRSGLSICALAFNLCAVDGIPRQTRVLC